MLYEHYKNKKLYEIVDKCLIQEDDKWVDAVIYRAYNCEQKFCRSKVEFFDKFKLVKYEI